MVISEEGVKTLFVLLSKRGAAREEGTPSSTTESDCIESLVGRGRSGTKVFCEEQARARRRTPKRERFIRVSLWGSILPTCKSLAKDLGSSVFPLFVREGVNMISAKIRQSTDTKQRATFQETSLRRLRGVSLFGASNGVDTFILSLNM